MFDQATFEEVMRTVGAHLAFRIGSIRFGALATTLLIAAVVVAGASVYRLWQIGKREDFQDRLVPLRGGSSVGPVPSRADRASWHERLGTRIAASRFVGIATQRQLLSQIAASGIKGRGLLASFIAAKVIAAVVMVGIAWFTLEWREMWAENPLLRLIVLFGALIVGWQLPHVFLTRMAAHRQQTLEQGIPDALDLLVICAEAGLSLDQAIEEVGRIMAASNHVVSEEFETTASEMRVAADRAKALENLAQRARLPVLRSLVATLVQSIRFGTPLAESLRMIATEMRAERAAKFEERAARLPVLLTIPLMGLILPSLMMVIGTPLALRIMDTLRGLLGAF